MVPTMAPVAVALFREDADDDDPPSTPLRRARGSSRGSPRGLPPGSPGRSLRGPAARSPGPPDGGRHPERTPGHGEGAEAANPDPRADGPGAALTSLLAEAEGRSTRRAEALRGVLRGLRPGAGESAAGEAAAGRAAGGAAGRAASRAADGGGCRRDQWGWARLPQVPVAGVAATAALQQEDGAESEEDSVPRPRAPPPPPMPMPQSSRPSSAGGASGTASGAASATRDYGAAGGLAEERCRFLEDRLARALVVADCESQAAQEAQEALQKTEHEAVLLEGQASRRDVELKSELLDFRAGHQRECDKLRNEARRLQSSLKDAQVRAKSEGQGRAGVAEQAEVLNQQLVAARNELQKRSHESCETRDAVAAMEERFVQHTEMLKWVAVRCAGALGEEDLFQDLHRNGEDKFADGVKRELKRTLALLRRRAIPVRAEDKENACNLLQTAVAPVPQKTPDTARRLASAQNELLHAQFEIKELEAAQVAFQARLSESELAASQAQVHTPRCPNYCLRTAYRSKVRAVDDERKRLQRRMGEFEEEARIEQEQRAEEREELGSRLQALQTGREASERRIEAEEETWIEMRQRARLEEAAVHGLRSEVGRAEAAACDAQRDAVQARTDAHAAEASWRRLEADLSELRALIGGAGPLDPSAAGGPHGKEVARLRAELHQRDEAYAHETLEAQRRLGEWRAATERADTEMQALRSAVDGKEAHVQTLQQQSEQLVEHHRRQQEKIDEAKRAMVQKALDEQARTLKNEYTGSLQAARGACEEEACSLSRCAEEHAELQRNLERVLEGMAALQQRTVSLDAERQQHAKELAEATQARTESDLMASEVAARAAAEQRAAVAAAASQAEFGARLAELQGAHAARLSALRGERNGECAALRALEAEAMHTCAEEVAAALAAHAQLAEAMRAASQSEAEESRVAKNALRSASARGRRVALRKELRDELYAELRGRCCEELRADVREEVRREVKNDPCSELRRSLRRDVKQELRDQRLSESRCESRNAIRSELRNSPGGASQCAAQSPSSIGVLHSARSRGSDASPIPQGASSVQGSRGGRLSLSPSDAFASPGLPSAAAGAAGAAGAAAPTPEVLRRALARYLEDSGSALSPGGELDLRKQIRLVGRLARRPARPACRLARRPAHHEINNL